MSVDALMDSDQMSREMIERVGPRVALQPCDNPNYRELAQEFLDFAAESDEPITIIRLTGENTVEVDYGLCGHIEPGTQLAVYNSILALHLAGEAEVMIEELVEIVDWGGQTLPMDEKLQIALAAIIELENHVPHASFFVDASSGILNLERDIVVIDSRFSDSTEDYDKAASLRLVSEASCKDEINLDLSVENAPEAVEANVAEAHSIVVDVDEQVLATEGLNRHSVKLQSKIYLEIDGIRLALTQDEYAVLMHAKQIGPNNKIKRSQVVHGSYWVPGERSTGAQTAAFTRAATRLCAKLPDSFRMVGRQSARKYFLIQTPDVVDLAHIEQDDQTADNPNLFENKNVVDTAVDLMSAGDDSQVSTEEVHTVPEESECDIDLSEKPIESIANLDESTIPEKMRMLMDTFLKEFRDERPLGIDNFSLATLQKLLFGNFDESLSLQPVKLSVMLDVTEDIVTRLLNYDLLAVDEAIIDRCYETLRFIKERRQAKELEDAIAENEHNAASNMHKASIQSGGMKADEEDFEWYDYGNCVGVDPDLFFPERGASTREAKAVCRGCEVREDCLEHALQNGEKFGIWGGLSERERRRIRRQRAQAARSSIGA